MMAISGSGCRAIGSTSFSNSSLLFIAGADGGAAGFAGGAAVFVAPATCAAAGDADAGWLEAGCAGACGAACANACLISLATASPINTGSISIARAFIPFSKFQLLSKGQTMTPIRTLRLNSCQTQNRYA